MLHGIDDFYLKITCGEIKKMVFDRNKDKKDAPKCQKGEDILNELESLRPIAFGKVGK